MRDTIRILVRSGRGGDGCVAFRREKFIPRGGPDGGDGGRGGHVYIRARDKISNLQNIRNNGTYRAGSGRPGMGSRMNGRGGEDEFIDVPPGTAVFDTDTGRLLQDLISSGDKLLVVKGGPGGRGNCHFATPENRVPREFEPGGEPQKLDLLLKFSIPADVAVTGLPNSGKSTLVSALTNSKTRVAVFPFSTTDVHLGVVLLDNFKSIRIIDTPAIVEGAAEGRGLGNRFLAHLARVSVALLLLDPVQMEGVSLPDQLRVLRDEISAYDPDYAVKRQLIVISKADLLDDELRERVEAVSADADGADVLAVSSETGEGLDRLREWFAELEVPEQE